MKKEETEIASLKVIIKKKQPIEISTTSGWCVIDFGDYSYGTGRRVTRFYEKKGEYQIIITAENLRKICIKGCYIDYANFSRCVNLKILCLSDTGLGGLNIKGCKELRLLSCRNNQLEYLDLYGFTKLRRLECDHNKLKILRLGRNFSLSCLQCNDNRLTDIYIPYKNSLRHLDCSNNQLSKDTLKKMFTRLFRQMPEKTGKVIFESNPGTPFSNTRKIIAKGWKIGKYGSQAA